ncbi:heparan-alpha-glucosaminide N-acetyltransferase [Amphibiibacter pelophylacis]|uniref:Heparan-alpha-glucosaminide N-acetyltransferase n=1 Tax=Amphibiibacter pelophylacis TaxID=1799477 RepID=A0ACC6P0G9_9BURK
MPGDGRTPQLDALRGLAVLWMVAFHFSFDLNWLGFIRPPFNFYTDPIWTLQRVAIVSLFLLCSGAAVALGDATQRGAGRFWRRWAQIAGSAALVSLGSWAIFPGSWISFGVLHAVAAMLLIQRGLRAVLLRWGGPAGRALAAQPLLWLALAAAVLALWLGVQHPWFDTRWTNPLGLVTHKPITEDYVPLAPWLAPFFIGYACAQALQRRPGWVRQLRHCPAGPAGLRWLGSHTLSIYLLHQPLLLGGLWALRHWVGV